MHDFQDSLRRMLFEADEEGPAPIGAPDKFNIQHHDGRMDKSAQGGAASDVIKQHLEAQAFEYKKLKTAYDELVKTVQEVFSGLGTYGIEDKGFLKGMKPMAAPQPQGQVSNPSQAAAMSAAQQFRQRMQTPINTSADDI